MSEFSWIDNFPEFSYRCLKVKNKAGEIVPFRMNEAQEYVHKRLEEQRSKMGMVRAVILKGRQQGCCYTPDMRVMTSDYRWVRIGDVSVGDRLISVDEDIGVSGKRTERRIRTSIVEAKVTFTHDVYEVLLHDGTKLLVTGEHRHLCKKRGGDNAEWRTVSNTKVGDFIRAAFYKPESDSPSFEDGWFGGLLDGEGSFGASPQVRIGVSQVDGAVLNRAKKYLSDVGIKHYELIDNRMAGESSKPVHCLRIDRLTDVVRLLVRTRPSRFVNRELLIGKKLPKTCEGFDAWLKVVSITHVGKREVVDIQTSEQTFICEGIVSHNSTYVEGRFFQRTATNFGINAFILTHEQQATDNLFGMTQRYYENYPLALRPSLQASNAKELEFGKLDSSFRVATAGNKGAGRSATAQLFHGSEVAYWPSASSHLAGIMQTVPLEPGTEIIFESTADGVGNVFHQLWEKGEAGIGGWQSIFVPWFWQMEYRTTGIELSEEDLEYGEIYKLDKEQLMWRRYKIGELGGDVKLFEREYPSSPAEAFSVSDESSLITSMIVKRARKCKVDKDRNAPMILGVDPARFGEDSTTIYGRCGRLSDKVDKVRGKDTMEVAGRVIVAIGKFNPDAVFIDVGGIGAGVYDRLKELGYSVVMPVNFGGEPLDKTKYVNKRAEMWDLMKLWLAEPPAEIPDDSVLETDLCSLRYDYDSKGRLKLESKDDAKKRGIKSPDDGDGLALTFAMPVQKRQAVDVPYAHGAGSVQFRPTVRGMGM